MPSSEENFNATITNLLSSIPSNMEENLRIFTQTIAQGPKTPIITNDPNDPRVKKYQDSLKLYNKYLLNDAAHKNSGKYLYNIYHPVDMTSNKAKGGIKPVTQNVYTNIDSPIKSVEELLRTQKTDANYNWQGSAVDVYKKPVQPVIYEENVPRLPGETIPTPVNKPILTDPLTHLESATKILDQIKDGDYSVTFGDPTKTESQTTQKFKNKAEFEAFIEALAAEDNSPRWITRSKNGAQALFTRRSTKDTPVGM